MPVLCGPHFCFSALSLYLQTLMESSSRPIRVTHKSVTSLIIHCDTVTLRSMRNLQVTLQSTELVDCLAAMKATSSPMSSRSGQDLNSLSDDGRNSSEIPVSRNVRFESQVASLGDST